MGSAHGFRRWVPLGCALLGAIALLSLFSPVYGDSSTAQPIVLGLALATLAVGTLTGIWRSAGAPARAGAAMCAVLLFGFSVAFIVLMSELGRLS